MRFLVGFVIGVITGGGGVYLALEKPWDREDDVVAEVDAGATVAATRRKRRGKRPQRKGRGSVEIPIEGDIPVLSPADRKLVWKGEAVTPPQQNVDFGAAQEGRPLTAAEINSTIREQSGGILDCITRSRGNAQLEASITAKLLVGPRGAVDKIRIRAPRYLFDHGFNPCARKALRGLRFPATGASTVVDAPFELY